MNIKETLWGDGSKSLREILLEDMRMRVTKREEEIDRLEESDRYSSPFIVEIKTTILSVSEKPYTEKPGVTYYGYGGTAEAAKRDALESALELDGV